MTIRVVLSAAVVVLLSSAAIHAQTATLSEATEECIDCHVTYTPGIVADWERSRHARTTPAEGMASPALERRISATSVPDNLSGTAVGCYECHSLNPAARHTDNFEHFGYQINVVVSPNDCMTCHPTEVEQYSDSKKAHAIGNLRDNPVYHMMVENILSVKTIFGGQHYLHPALPSTENEACFGCHGTTVTVIGTRTISTDFDDIEVPVLSNWPNEGWRGATLTGAVGVLRAHPRHGFSIEVARKPYSGAVPPHARPARVGGVPREQTW